MSWLFSQALVAAYSEAISSDGEPSAPLSGSHTQLAYLPPDRMTAFSRPSRFGMTFRPLTEDLGAAVLTSYLAAFPARTSALPAKGAGIDGARSGMWGHMARIVGEVRPRYVFVENSPALLTRGLGRVLGDLAALGYDCRWTVLGAADVGAPHQRDRFWLVANARSGRCGKPSQWQDQQQGRAETIGSSLALANTDSLRQLQQGGIEPQERGWPSHSGAEMRNPDRQRLAVWQGQRGDARQELQAIERADWWQSEPNVGRVAHGVAARVDRLKAIGNGQVPLCAATAWRLLTA